MERLAWHVVPFFGHRGMAFAPPFGLLDVLSALTLGKWTPPKNDESKSMDYPAAFLYLFCLSWQAWETDLMMFCILVTRKVWIVKKFLEVVPIEIIFLYLTVIKMIAVATVLTQYVLLIVKNENMASAFSFYVVGIVENIHKEGLVAGAGVFLLVYLWPCWLVPCYEGLGRFCFVLWLIGTALIMGPWERRKQSYSRFLTFAYLTLAGCVLASVRQQKPTQPQQQPTKP
jgi:hypothetical protein